MKLFSLLPRSGGKFSSHSSFVYQSVWGKSNTVFIKSLSGGKILVFTTQHIVVEKKTTRFAWINFDLFFKKLCFSFLLLPNKFRKQSGEEESNIYIYIYLSKHKCASFKKKKRGKWFDVYDGVYHEKKQKSVK